MILADRTTVDGFNSAFWQRLVFQGFNRLAGDLATIHEEAAFGPFEQNTIVTFAGDDHFNVVWHVDLDLESRRRVVLIIHNRMAILVFHRQLKLDGCDLAWPGFCCSKGPACDIDMMSTPVSELSTGVFVPVAECVVAVAMQRYATTVSGSHLWK